MRSLLCENLCSESFPNFDGKFIQGGDSWNKGDTGRPGDSEIELLTGSVIRNIVLPDQKAAVDVPWVVLLLSFAHLKRFPATPPR